MRISPALSLQLILCIFLGSETNGQWHFDPPKPEGHVCGSKGEEIWTCRRESECRALKALVEKGRRITCSRTAGVHSICCPPVPARITDSISKIKCAEYQALNTCGYKQSTLLGSIGGGDPNTPPFPGAKPYLEGPTTAKKSGQEGDAFSEYGGPDDPDDADDVAVADDPDILTTTNYPNEPIPVVGIRGGMKAAAGEHPHTALIGFGDEDGILWLCGGTLVSELWVVSAAHCTGTSRGPPRWVRLGDLDYEKAEDDAHVQQFQIVEIQVHEDYKAPALYNDIALFRLDREAVLNKFVAPACLYHGTGEPEGLATATGWGKLQRNLWKSHLMKVNLNFVETEECKAKQIRGDPESLPSGIDGRTMICTWDQGKDTCQGDSGGPLVLADKGNNCLHQLVGITSFGPPGCDDSLVPSTYVRVSAFTPWIESIVWPTT